MKKTQHLVVTGPDMYVTILAWVTMSDYDGAGWGVRILIIGGEENCCLSNLRCHCEPVRTLAWQSPGSSGMYEKRITALTNRPELLGDCHTRLRPGSQ